MKGAVIFDLDGVVINSNPFHRAAWSNFLNNHGVIANEEIFSTVIFGTTGNQALKKLLGESCSDKQIANYVNEIDAEYRKIICASANLRPLNGLLELLKGLKELGIGIALATSAPDANIDLVLDKLKIRHFFDLIVGKSKVVNGKPNPEVYLTTMQQLSLSCKHCLVFEDSISGVKAAYRAGIVVIGVTTSHTPDELLNAGAQSTINDFKHISLNDIDDIIH
jgi:beta-phosphoglucomutase